MKKVTYILAFALMLSVILNILAISGAIRMGIKYDDMAGANDALAQQLFFEDLEKRTIQIFSYPNGVSTSFTDSGYTVILRRLHVAQYPDSGTPNYNFVQHNHGEVVAFACKQWDTNRDFAVRLINMLAFSEPNAAAIRQALDLHGSQDTNMLTWIEACARQHDYRYEAFQRSR